MVLQAAAPEIAPAFSTGVLRFWIRQPSRHPPEIAPAFPAYTPSLAIKKRGPNRAPSFSAVLKFQLTSRAGCSRGNGTREAVAIQTRVVTQDARRRMRIDIVGDQEASNRQTTEHVALERRAQHFL